MKLYGILTIEMSDSSGETILGSAINPEELQALVGSPVSWEFRKDLEVVPFGLVTAAKKFTGFEVYATPDELDLLLLAGHRPFVSVEIKPTDPAATKVLAEAMEAEHITLGFGLGGYVLEREGSLLTKIRVTDVAVTNHPVNPLHRVHVKL